MRSTVFLLILFSLFTVGCGSRASNTGTTANSSNANAAPKTPADGFFPGKGKVTKINNELGSVELDHEEIPDLMPAMRMEFYLKDKAMLKSIAVGDEVTFTLEHKQGTETIVAIGK